MEMADPVATGGNEDIFAEFKDFMGGEPIPSPVDGMEKTAMIIGTVMGRGVIGSVYSMPGDLDDVWVFYPISFREAVRANSQGQVAGVDLQIGRVFHSTSRSKLARMRLEYFTILRADSSKDRKIVSAYVDAIESHRVEDTGMVSAAASLLVGASR